MAVERSSKYSSTFAKNIEICKFECGAPGCRVVPGRVQNSSGSGSAFEQSSGSGLIGFLFFRKLRVRVYRV